MKVLHVVGSFPIPPFGGVEATAYEVGRELSRLGVETKVVAPTDMPRNVREDGCEFIGLRAGRVSDWIQIPSWKSVGELRRLILWADFVHVLNPQELFTLLSIGWTLKERRPLVLSMPIIEAMGSHPQFWFRWAGALDDRLVRLAVRRASLVHVKNAMAFGQLSKFTSRGILIPDGFESALLTPRTDSSTFRRAIGLEDAFPLLLFLGRLHPLKGPDQLIRAVPFLRDIFPRVAVAIVGRDYEGSTTKLKDLAEALGVSDRVRIPGPIPPERKCEILDAADVVVVPSLADFVEGFSMVASEAWARGKPVAGYPVGALKSRVKTGVNGYLADGMTIRDLVVAISKATNLPRVEPPSDVISWAEVARRYAEMYSRLAGNAAARGTGPVPPPAVSGVAEAFPPK